MVVAVSGGAVTEVMEEAVMRRGIMTAPVTEVDAIMAR